MKQVRSRGGRSARQPRLESRTRGSNREVVLQIEVSGPTDPIMRRLHADREEKRVTRGNVTNPEQDGLTPHSPIREDSKG